MDILAIVSAGLNLVIVVGGLILAPQIMRTGRIEKSIEKIEEKIEGLPCIEHAEKIGRLLGKLNGK